MASHSQPQIVAYKADAAITKGMAVKPGSDNEHVAKGSANTSKCLGIAQNAAASAEDVVEIAIGGGCKALLGENVVAGNFLVSHTDGSLVKANASGDHIVCKAMTSGSSGDLIDVQIAHSQAAAAE